jgi:flagellar assembly protein FliH
LSKLLKSNGLQPVYAGTMEIPVKSVRQAESAPNELVKSQLPSSDEQYASVKNECKLMLDKANAEAQRICEQARSEVAKELETAKQDGFKSGYDEGYVRATKELEAKYEAVIAQANEIVSEIEADRFHRLQNVSGVIVKITMEAVRMLLSRELEIKEPDIQSMVSELIQYVMDCTQIEVRVHPHDFPAAMASHAAWKGMKFGEWEVAVVPDLQIGRGSCEIRSRIGRVDATLETRMDQLENAVNRAILQLSAGEENDTN